MILTQEELLEEVKGKDEDGKSKALVLCQDLVQIKMRGSAS